MSVGRGLPRSPDIVSEGDELQDVVDALNRLLDEADYDHLLLPVLEDAQF